MHSGRDQKLAVCCQSRCKHDWAGVYPIVKLFVWLCTLSFRLQEFVVVISYNLDLVMFSKQCLHSCMHYFKFLW